MLYFLISLMVLAWSANYIVAKLALEELPPFALLFLRVMFSNVILLAIYWGSRHHRRRPLRRGDLRWFALLGLFAVGINQTGFTVGLNYTTVGHSSLIVALSPIWVLLLATWMKQERLTRWKAVGLALSFAGVAVLAAEHGLGSHSPTFLGDVITLSAGVGFALYTVYGKHVSQRYDTLTFNTFTYLAGAVVVVPVAGWQLFDVNWHQVGWKGWLGALYMAAIASVTAYLIFYYALTKISATRVVAFSYLQPVLATLLAILLLGEKVTPHLLVGGALVVTGVYLAEIGGHEPHPAN